LRKDGFDLDAVDYAKKPLDEATVRAIVRANGGVAGLVNTRHATAKEKGWADSPPDTDTFAKAVTKDVNLLRRPILIVGKKFIVGFDKAAYSKLK
jgi:arsenate reductase-like glutaredoxin family protein